MSWPRKCKSGKETLTLVTFRVYFVDSGIRSPNFRPNPSSERHRQNQYCGKWLFGRLSVRYDIVQQAVTDIPCSGRAHIHGAVHDISSLRFGVCRSYCLLEERVWTVTFFPHSYASFLSRDYVCVFLKCHIWLVTTRENFIEFWFD